MKLWLFGQSMSTAHGVDETQSWPYLIAQKLGVEYTNFSQSGADNFYIYHSFLENIDNISQEDLVIIGWSHPSRKSFVFDVDNPTHQKAITNNLQYKTKTQTLFRKYNTRNSSKFKWQSMLPSVSGQDFYDQWFKNYYSDYEQRCNFQAYLDSVNLRVSARYIPFYFSQESVDQIRRQNDNFMLEFITNNNVAISPDDYHLNVQGHQLWADKLILQIQ